MTGLSWHRKVRQGGTTDPSKFVFVGNNNDGSTTSTANGAVTRFLLETEIGVSTVSGWASMTTPYAASGTSLPWTGRFKATMKVRRVSVGGSQGPSMTDVTFFFGLIDSTVFTSNDFTTNVTAKHIGFLIENDVLYTSTRTGTSQTKTVVSGYTLPNCHTYQISREADRVDFYINGTLVGTHVTNLPTTRDVGIRFHFGLDNQGGFSVDDFGSMAIGNDYTLVKNP